MTKILKKRVTEEDVLTLARERVSVIFDRFDHVAVSFSGGKDSTVCLNLALEEARRRGRLPLDVFFWDEEAIHPETVDYVERVSELDGVSFRWLCHPVEHRNACSRKQPYWHPWAPEKRDLWCRPLPEKAIHDPEFPRIPIPGLNHRLFDSEQGTIGIILGIRAQESVRRYMSVSMRVYDNYISHDPFAKQRGLAIYLTKPIYDWSIEDVWTAPFRLGWDYNRTYDVFNALGYSRQSQRVCPPYGEEPLASLWLYAQAWPELWEKMVRRVPGANTAARYSRSPLFSFGVRYKPPEGVSYQEAIEIALSRWPDEIRSKIQGRIREEMALHRKRSGNVPIPDSSSFGLSWEFLYMIAVRGDFKHRKKVRYEGQVAQK